MAECLNLFVLTLIQGRHNKAGTPIPYSSIIKAYSGAIIPNKCFGRDVIGLTTFKTVKNFAKKHRPKHKVAISLYGINLIGKLIAKRLRALNFKKELNSIEWCHVVGGLVFTAQTACCLRVGSLVQGKCNVRKDREFDLSMVTINPRSPGSLQGVVDGIARIQSVTLVISEKQDKAAGVGTPHARMHFSAKPPKESLTVCETWEVYLRATKTYPGMPGWKEGLKFKGANKKFKAYHRNAYNTFLGHIAKDLGHQLHSMFQTRANVNASLIRRSVVCALLLVFPPHFVKDLMRHASITTTLAHYALVTDKEMSDNRDIAENLMLGEALDPKVTTPNTPALLRNENISNYYSTLSEIPLCGTP